MLMGGIHGMKGTFTFSFHLLYLSIRKLYDYITRSAYHPMYEFSPYIGYGSYKTSARTKQPARAIVMLK